MLGYWKGQPVMVMDVVAETMPMRARISLRQAMFMVDEKLQALAGRAAQVLSWDRDHRYCSRCATPLQPMPHERARTCPACQLAFYPRINPCIIVLVTRGDAMLLAQGVRFIQPFFSCLAGFIEAGESAEEALHREVFEEVGLRVSELQYFRSQPWPFPHSLMLGYHATYLSGELRPDPAEIVEARWFEPDAPMVLPPAGSLARALIDAHLLRVRYNGTRG
ncbi:MAG: NAD(+) diphosphatase [Pseudomonadales bacterium]|nr:NAD(+) diphosphatase [Pseudomonadales bacterium]